MKYKLADLICSANTGADAIKRAPIVEEKTGLKCLRIGDVSQNKQYDQWGYTRTTLEDYKRYKLHGGNIIVARTGNTIGVCKYIESEIEAVYNNGLIRIEVDNKKILPRYFFYIIRGKACQDYIQAIAYGTSTQPNMKIKDFLNFEVEIPMLLTQKKTVSVIDAIERKIALNNKINDNLEQQVMALYKQMFIENANAARREYRVDEYFNISIGKTPPRKEPQWFSENPADCVWVSISDMGSCGLFIANSSEYLTHEAVKKFNVKVVPNNTVLLSFKLTVGRIAITDGAMATNEAIAHFKTDKPEINEYLYCYLKNFNYQMMGSTSSIATAVNSKIIKGMPFVIPTDGELAAFHGFAGSIFAMIKSNQRENNRLATLRDSLLPKLMSGEIDVFNIQL